MNDTWHASVRAGLAIGVLALSGCACPWERPARADGTYCYVLGKVRNSVCTVQTVPSIDADRQAKRFQPDEQAFTLYVVRYRWADASRRVPVTIDTGSEVTTVPGSMVRLRLKPGTHRLSFTWQGETKVQTVEGRAGDVQFIQLVVSSWSWSRTCEWDSAHPDDARARALKTRLVADFDLR